MMVDKQDINAFKINGDDNISIGQVQLQHFGPSDTVNQNELPPGEAVEHVPPESATSDLDNHSCTSSFLQPQIALTSTSEQLNLSDYEEASSSLDFCSRICDDDTITIKRSNYISFICPECGVAFETNGEWQTHINVAHNFKDVKSFNFERCGNNEFKCQKCERGFTRCTLNTLQQHCFMHLPFKVYKCKMCGYEAINLFLMISHIMLHKNSEDLSLYAHGKNDSVSQLHSLLDSECDTLISYICPECGDNFGNEDSWQAHINFQHNFLQKVSENQFEDHFKCYQCSLEIFSHNISDLQKHLFTHLPYKSYMKCKVCNWTNSRRNFIVTHIHSMHKDEIANVSAASVGIIRNVKEDKNDPILASNLSTTMPLNYNSTSAIKQLYLNKNFESNMSLENGRNHLQKTRKRKYKTSSLDPNKNDYAAMKRRKGPGFSCSGCELLFKTAAERNEHNIASHPKYRCQFCESSFALKNVYKFHKCLKLNGKRIKL